MSDPSPAPDAETPRRRRFVERLGFGRDWSLIPSAIVIGLLMSGVAIAFIWPLHLVEEHSAHLGSPLIWWLVPTVPIVGGLLCGVVQHVIKSEGRGPGVSKVMWAVHRQQGRLPLRLAFRKWLAATATIASGGSAGAEGPIATIGSTVGSNVAGKFGAGRQGRATLLGCGAAAGIASVFNAPIAGVFFTLEVLLRDFSLRTFTPIVIASVVAAAVTHGVLGENVALFDSGAELIQNAFTWHELPNYILLGLLCGTAAPVFIRSSYATGRAFERIPTPGLVKPAIGGAIVGLLGLGWLLLVPGQGEGLPDFMGNGYPVIRDLLNVGFYYEPGVDASGAEGAVGVLRPALGMIALLAVVGLLKGVATCITIGSGGAGGVFAPSMVIGAAIGASFGHIVNAIGLFPSASPAHYALVGMAAMTAATLHAPLTSMLIVYEITRTYEVILPLMLAAVLSTIVARLWYRESMYSVVLTQMGLRMGSMTDLTLLRRIVVDDVPLIAPVFVHPDDSAERLLELSERLSVADFVVTDHEGRYLGLVTQADLKEALVYREAIPLLQVHELMRDDLPILYPQDTIDVAIDKFARCDGQSLAVLHHEGSRSASGLLSRERLMARYHAALEGDA